MKMFMRPGRLVVAMGGSISGISLQGRVLAGLIAVYSTALWITKIGIYRKSLLTSDMAISCNVLWNTDFRGQFLFSDILYLESGYRSLLNQHFCPTLLLLAPIYRLFPSPAVLLLFQTAMPGLTALLLYRFGLSILGAGREPGPPSSWTANPRWLSLGVAAAYLYHPFLRMATTASVYGFQPDSAIPPLIVGLAHALYRQRWRTGLILLLLLYGLKENMPALGCLLGIGMVSTCRKGSPYRVAGGVIAGLGLLIFLIGVFAFPWLTGLPGKNLALLARMNPNVLVGRIWVLLPWGVLLLLLPSILAPEILALALPEWLVYTAMGVRPFDWHVFPSLAIFAVACVAGVSRILSPPGWLSARLHFSPLVRSRLLLASCIVFLVHFVVGICEGGLTMGLILGEREEVSHECLKKVEPFVPQTGYLATTSELMVHFSNRPHLLAPTQFRKADYLLVNFRNPGVPYRYEYDVQLIHGVRELLAAGALEVVLSCKSRESEVLLFRRTGKLN